MHEKFLPLRCTKIGSFAQKFYPMTTQSSYNQSNTALMKTPERCCLMKATNSQYSGYGGPPNARNSI